VDCGVDPGLDDIHARGDVHRPLQPGRRDADDPPVTSLRSGPAGSASLEADLVVIGSGPAAVRRALGAAARRRRVVLAARRPPSLRGDRDVAAALLAALPPLGDAAGWPAARAAARRRFELAALRTDRLLRDAGVRVLIGEVHVADPRLVTVTAPGSDLSVRARRVAVMPEPMPVRPDLPGSFETRALTAADVLELAELPASVAVLGAGATGCELAQTFARAGAAVTVLEAEPRLLPDLDPAASALVAGALAADGVRVLTGTRAEKLAPTLDGGAWIGATTDVAAECLVLAAGWSAGPGDETVRLVRTDPAVLVVRSPRPPKASVAVEADPLDAGRLARALVEERPDSGVVRRLRALTRRLTGSRVVELTVAGPDVAGLAGPLAHALAAGVTLAELAALPHPPDSPLATLPTATPL
jgi:NADPH-dependent 2,4-dienoyl-CoA reductase/sulfur reductase-like enzyme